jgi:uncharacterized protein
MKYEVFKDTQIVGLGLYFSKEKILAITDLHFGIEEMLNKQGVMMPRINFNEIKKELLGIYSKTGKVNKTIVLGDLKHEFGSISPQEWQEVIDAIEIMENHSEEIILIRGNHDRILGPLAGWKKLLVAEEFFLEDKKTIFLHGDKLSKSSDFKKAKNIIIGHEHPAISIREGGKTEKYKCFLVGKHEGKNLIVMPSMNSISVGSDVLREKILSPFIKEDLKGFSAWVLGDKPYYFEDLKKLKSR